MTGKKRAFAPSIIAKLLIWCVALIAIFYLTTIYLFAGIRDITRVAGNVVAAGYEMDAASKSMIQRLLSLEENMRMYEILEDETYRKYVISDLTAYRDILDSVIRGLDKPGEPWITLSRGYNELSANGTSETVSIPYDTVAHWVELLDGVRRGSQERMRAGLDELEARGGRAQRMGLIGMIASLAVGLAGSLIIAFRLSRTLRELMRGIRSVGRSGPATRVRVASGDELGELARTFNTMAERLEREERLRSDFIAMLSHEVRTPLTSVRESVDLVSTGVFGEVNAEQKRFLDIAGKEADRLSALLKRLLSVSSLERNTPAPEPVPIDARELAEGAAERMEPAASAKGQAIRVEGPAAPAKVLADPGHVQLVFLNLLGNAVKFAPRDTEIRLEIEADPGGGRCVFRVRDQGPGIPEGDRDLVFSKFYRGAAADTGVDGTGLGLSISRFVVEAHGGGMWLDDSPEGGAVVCFSLPLARETG